MSTEHRYAAYIGPRTGRLLTATSYPYPKADQRGAVARTPYTVTTARASSWSSTGVWGSIQPRTW